MWYALKMKQKWKENQNFRKVIFWIGILLGWQLISVIVNNQIICPSPLEVGQAMILQIQSELFGVTIISTLVRALIGLIVSMLLGIALSCLALFVHWIRFAVDNIVFLMQSIPSACYVILILFWSGRQMTMFIVIACLVFPMVYRNLLASLVDIEKEWKDVFFMYPQPWYTKLSKAYFPAMKPAFSSSLLSASSLAFKSGVMAEVLGSANFGIGRMIQNARANVEVVQVMAWMVWLLVLVFLSEKAMRWIIHRLYV